MLLHSCDQEVLEKGEAGEVLLRFNRSGPELDLALVTWGHVPLPPYIRGGNMVDADISDYQTVFAKQPGAVAAPYWQQPAGCC